MKKLSILLIEGLGAIFFPNHSKRILLTNINQKITGFYQSLGYKAVENSTFKNLDDDFELYYLTNEMIHPSYPEKLHKMNQLLLKNGRICFDLSKKEYYY
jgi:hypothetical protein